MCMPEHRPPLRGGREQGAGAVVGRRHPAIPGNLSGPPGKEVVMNRLHRIFAAGVATAALAFSASPALAASPAVMTPAYSCSIDSLTHVESSVDFLRVHTSPGVGTPAVGEIPGGSAFHFCSSSFQSSG